MQTLESTINLVENDLPPLCDTHTQEPHGLPTAIYEDLFARLIGLYRESFKDVIQSEAHLEQMTHDSLSEERGAEFFQIMEERLGTIHGKRVFEVGSGICMGLALARARFGADAHGIEPGEDEYSGSIELGRNLLKAMGQLETAVKFGVGEAIPHPDNTFDLVYSNNVLEHTADPAKVIAESLRVLKPGGIMYHVVPNYGSWWEGHYGVLWIPFMTKWMGRLYLRLLGKNPAYLDTLQLISRPWLKRMLKPHQQGIEVLSWGQDLFEKRLRTLEFTEYAALGRLKRKLKVLRKIGVLGLLCWIGKLLHWETPLILTVRKKGSPAAAVAKAA